MAQAEIVLLRDAEFKCSPREEDWLDGWTVGEILWVHDPIRRADASMTADVMALTSGDLEAAPEEGWRKLTFIHGLGFGTGSTREEVKQNLSDHVAWLMLTPFGDYAIRD